MRSCVRPIDAVRVTAGPDEVREPGPIRRASFEALTAPRGVPAAVPIDYHHSLLPLHSGDEALTADIIALASQFGRYGYPELYLGGGRLSGGS
jgi:hypothetical protein